MNKKAMNGPQGGYLMLLNTVLFIGIAFAVIIGASSPLVAQRVSAQGMLASKQSYMIGHSAAEDAFYRLKKSITLPASSVLTLPYGSATITTTDSGGVKTISVTSEQDDYERDLELKVAAGSGIDFNYGLQAGNGGITITGGSTVFGNVYSNGSIAGTGGSKITGTAVAADSDPLAADQVNESPSTPTSSINFRNSSAAQDFAQSFQVSDTAPVSKIQFYIKKTGSPANPTIKIMADNAGSPSTSVIVSVSLNAGLITTSYGWVEAVFATKPALIPGTTYWVTIQNGSQSSSNYYTIGANSSYANGQAKTGREGSTWNTTGLDGYFRLYTGGISAYIGGANYDTGLVVGSSTTMVGDAWAGIVKGTSAYGKIYCTDTVQSTNNGEPCDTSKGIPPQEPLPFSEGNIQDWKDAAAAGGSQGATSIGWAGGTLGPRKITGNLNVSGGGTLTLTGPIWVTGNVDIGGGGKIVLPAGYAGNSEMIVADGTIVLGGGSSTGSGQTGSYIFVVSLSRCPNDVGCSGTSAISVNGGAGAIAANAQYGNINLTGAAKLNAVTGNSITVSGGSEVTYDAGLASPSFQSGPSGGYNVIDWIEL